MTGSEYPGHGPDPADEPVVDLRDQHHVVIGAASGIGRTVAHRLASLGAVVVCMDQDGAGAERTTKEIVDQGQKARSAMIDVRDEDSVRDAFARAVAELGTLHALVNSAGSTGATGLPTHQVDPFDFDRVYQVNLRGAFLVSRAVLPHMVANGYGRILHIASISGKDGNEGMAAYSASKAGLIGLVKVMGKEYATTGVTVNAMSPAVIRTPMVDALPAEQVQYMTSKIPMRRCGTLTEVADLAAWIVSAACSFTTAFTFDLSGGRAVY